MDENIQASEDLIRSMGVYERALTIAVEARTLARAAHERQDSMDTNLSAIRSELTDFKAVVAGEFSSIKETLASLKTKAGIFAAVGAAAAAAVVPVIIHYLP